MGILLNLCLQAIVFKGEGRSLTDIEINQGLPISTNIKSKLLGPSIYTSFRLLDTRQSVGLISPKIRARLMRLAPKFYSPLGSLGHFQFSKSTLFNTQEILASLSFGRVSTLKS